MLKVALAEMPPHVMLGAGTPPAGASAGCPPGRRLHLGYLAAKTAATGTTANGQGPLRDLGGGDPLSLSAAPAAPPIGRKDSPMLSKKVRGHSCSSCHFFCPPHTQRVELIGLPPPQPCSAATPHSPYPSRWRHLHDPLASRQYPRHICLSSLT